MKLFYKNLFIGLLTLTFISCDKGDDNQNDTSSYTSKIIGVWKIEGYEYNGVYEKPQNCEAKETIDFGSDGKATYMEYKTKPNGECQSHTGKINYSVSNGILTNINPTGGYKGGEYIKKYNILTLTDSKLKLELFYEVDGYKEDGELPKEKREISFYKRVK